MSRAEDGRSFAGALILFLFTLCILGLAIYMIFF